MIAPKLKQGDEIRIVAPSQSMHILTKEQVDLAVKRLNEMGFKVSFGEHVLETDCMMSSSIHSRVTDIHEAFNDTNVKAILTVIGGFNSNQLLPYLDYDLIAENPKILCGLSDITALATAIYTQTELVTYSGPHFSTFSMERGVEFIQESFQACLTQKEEYVLKESPVWSDDPWYLDQQNRNFIPNSGLSVVHPGEAEGILIGGNLCTLNLLQGTEFMPNLKDAILFLEDDELITATLFDRDLESLLSQPGANEIKGLVIGRFQNQSAVTEEELNFIIKTKTALQEIPVITGADFGHTQPIATFPIGGKVHIDTNNEAKIRIMTH
ncbi:LD-carboxypeptidase [Listeria ivanovii]|uniref:Peptidase S66 n=1 Tax=Listeria ivanovii (strain ATCC BAA-678 / PAM 55) TaxID=881621 RepID=G2ZB03_LISIP|nr:S66 peptidase family protein [Listeria ivanovii]MBK3915614.1 LD-carboxypeptidase [Listeria ivanovii subsp. ivanovii]MBK3922709.1 LD-carboxypeptidase [Listeria ivanovii subsp. ivanovii]MBK3927869.1 LD-carboxypeptidase [Listeria ivanovii subsp. ivanovii]MCJ1718620.1 LD-carboxypeptidase [Listeria ivanovii]MCJ1723810.1 LD-carboxypeptidase [Listeria ivanovii]